MVVSTESDQLYEARMRQFGSKCLIGKSFLLTGSKMMDTTEPENLSTKPEDLRLTVKAEVRPPSPPPISLVAGRVESSSSPSNYSCFLPYGTPASYSPSAYLP